MSSNGQWRAMVWLADCLSHCNQTTPLCPPFLHTLYTIRQWRCIFYDWGFLSALYRSLRKFLVDGKSLLCSLSWKELHTIHVLGSLSTHGCALLRGTCWGDHFPWYVPFQKCTSTLSSSMESTFPITGSISKLLKYKAIKQPTSKEARKSSSTISTGASLSLGFLYRPV